jgi:hypothetical protein
VYGSQGIIIKEGNSELYKTRIEVYSDTRDLYFTTSDTSVTGNSNRTGDELELEKNNNTHDPCE